MLIDLLKRHLKTLIFFFIFSLHHVRKRKIYLTCKIKVEEFCRFASTSSASVKCERGVNKKKKKVNSICACMMNWHACWCQMQ